MNLGKEMLFLNLLIIIILNSSKIINGAKIITSEENLIKIDNLEEGRKYDEEVEVPFESKEDLCLNGTIWDEYNDDALRTSLVWNDDFCNEYRCTLTNGRYSIEITSCGVPVPPLNAIECHLHKSEEKETMYPYCCTKLRCIVLIDGKKYIQVIGQPRESISNELYKYCSHEDESHENHNHTGSLNKLYPLQSAEVKEPEAPQTNKDEALSPLYVPKTKLEHDSIFEWLLWPLEAIFLSESEIFRIVKARHERYYDYNKLWWA